MTKKVLFFSLLSLFYFIRVKLRQKFCFPSLLLIMETLTSTDIEKKTRLKNVEDSLERISNHNGVVGYFVIEPTSGKVMRYSGFDKNPKEVTRYVEKLRGFIDLASSTIRMIDWKDSMTFLRLNFGSFDIMVAPDLEKQYTLVVVQHIE